ncbi:hypothetical protein GXN76_09870 [Kroppenstedtia pulmonis]|uniref:Uncharacterized protein n=1 Tax=Kroppenstedtia pulmonis TaxID=1380685 RepID=A0A7D4BK91_9BACL|nr:hypothetical protein [Kroppenstedtia pulmonis]QKG84750.1 hypothetical protein GXN76_09870 [Kroppenstedtia pulmonis]
MISDKKPDLSTAEGKVQVASAFLMLSGISFLNGWLTGMWSILMLSIAMLCLYELILGFKRMPMVRLNQYRKYYQGTVWFVVPILIMLYGVDVDASWLNRRMIISAGVMLLLVFVAVFWACWVRKRVLVE